MFESVSFNVAKLGTERVDPKSTIPSYTNNQTTPQNILPFSGKIPSFLKVSQATHLIGLKNPS